jgi:hypothetical protein
MLSRCVGEPDAVRAPVLASAPAAPAVPFDLPFTLAR